MSSLFSNSKPFQTLTQQVERLRQHGLIIEDPSYAESILAHINYYRLSAYSKYFQKFSTSIRFEDVLELYYFDDSLRALIFEAIKPIEISFRTQWAYQIAKAHGSHSLWDSTYSKNFRKWEKSKENLDIELKRNAKTELFICDYVTKYGNYELPSWMCCEVMSFGAVSIWYQNWNDPKTKNQIAKHYDLDYELFESWIHNLSILRNTVAHHSRTWNKKFVMQLNIKPPIQVYQVKIASLQFQTEEKEINGVKQIQPSTYIYNYLVVLLYLLDYIETQDSWRSRFVSFLKEYPQYLQPMGFPKNWENHPIWLGKI